MQHKLELKDEISFKNFSAKAEKVYKCEVMSFTYSFRKQLNFRKFLEPNLTFVDYNTKAFLNIAHK